MKAWNLALRLSAKGRKTEQGYRRFVQLILRCDTIERVKEEETVG